MTTPACRLCGQGLAEAFEIRRAPSSVERLLLAHEVAGDRATSLSVQQCRDCGLVQLARLMPEGFYDDYEMAVTFSPRFQGYLNDLAADFLAQADLGDGRIAEIGCGDGSFLECFARRGFEVTGVEPSRRFRRAARAKGLTVHPTYVGRDAAVPAAPYDAVVSRQVLEHVPDINGFLAGMRASMAAAGHGLIEVPSLEKAVADGRFYDFFPDHVNYFSAQTLAYACRRNGMRTSSIVPTMADEYITAFVTPERAGSDQASRPGDHMDLSAVAAAIETTISALQGFLQERRDRGQRVAAWGSGGKGVSTFAAASPLEGIAYVVDADPRKQGHFMPVSHFEVHSPDRLVQDPVDCVLVTAIAHAAEIQDILRRDLGFDGTIALLGDGIDIHEKGQASAAPGDRQ